MEENYSPVIERAQKVRAQMAESVARFERRNRVTITTVILMLSVAGFYDLLQFILDWIPFVGWILSFFVGIFAWLTFYTWTSIKGWGFSDTAKKWIVWLLQGLSIIPVLNFGPEIMAGVLLTILIVKSDDFVYNRTKGRVDAEIIKEGIAFFNLFREV